MASASTMTRFTDLETYDSVEYNRLRTEFIAKFNSSAQSIAQAAFDTLVPANLKTSVKSIADSVDYQGFNPITILTEFYTRGVKDKTTGLWEIKDDSGNVILEVSKGGDPVSDLAILVLIFTMRGTMLQKIMKKIQQQWVPVLEAKIKTYNLTQSKSATTLGPKDITLARLAGCVPQFVVLLMEENIGRVYIDVNIFMHAANVTIYPRGMFTQMFSGVVPRSGVGSDLIQHCYAYSYLFDAVINPKKAINDFPTHIKEIQGYVDAANKSNLYDDNYRRFILLKMGLLKDKTTLSKLGERLISFGQALWNCIIVSTDKSDARLKMQTYLKTPQYPTPINKTPASAKKSTTLTELGEEITLEKSSKQPAILSDEMLESFESTLESFITGPTTMTLQTLNDHLGAIREELIANDKVQQGASEMRNRLKQNQMFSSQIKAVIDFILLGKDVSLPQPPPPKTPSPKSGKK